ncbi:integrase core domain-containing protein [Aquisphaera giovannonii]|uniref:integrase core domain-containing protein n=1 Tax=Aquisphaera giovannonii TaxID=406548 RepID=UPI0011E04AF4
MFDRTADGRSPKWLSLVDGDTRECLALEARRRMTSEEVARSSLATWQGAWRRRARSAATTARRSSPRPTARIWSRPAPGRCRWPPGSPWQNGYADSFHSKLRDEPLELEEFQSPEQADLWKEEYNTERPHRSVRYMPPTYCRSPARCACLANLPPQRFPLDMGTRSFQLSVDHETGGQATYKAKRSSLPRQSEQAGEGPVCLPMRP